MDHQLILASTHCFNSILYNFTNFHTISFLISACFNIYWEFQWFDFELFWIISDLWCFKYFNWLCLWNCASFISPWIMLLKVILCWSEVSWYLFTTSDMWTAISLTIFTLCIAWNRHVAHILLNEWSVKYPSRPAFFNMVRWPSPLWGALQCAVLTLQHCSLDPYESHLFVFIVVSSLYTRHQSPITLHSNEMKVETEFKIWDISRYNVCPQLPVQNLLSRVD